MNMIARFLPTRIAAAPADALQVQPLRKRHLPSVMAIEAVSHPKPWSEAIFRSELERMATGERHYIVGRQRGQLVGFGGLMFVVDEAHVTNIAVAEGQRRNGVGRRLLAELVGHARARQCVAMTLEVRASNVTAQALYRSFGFVPAGVRQRYYENVEDAIVMWNHDIATDDYVRRMAELCPHASWLSDVDEVGQ